MRSRLRSSGCGRLRGFVHCADTPGRYTIQQTANVMRGRRVIAVETLGFPRSGTRNCHAAPWREVARMGKYTVTESSCVQWREEEKTYTTEELREQFGDRCLVSVLLDRIEELEKDDAEACKYTRRIETQLEDAVVRAEELENKLIAKTADHETCATAMFEAETRIEELGELLDTQRELYETSVARVEELEAEQCEIGGIEFMEKTGRYIITNEMIDELLKAECHRAMGIIGIKRCDGCGGSGKKPYPEDRWADDGWICCPDCAPWGSKGWVIGQIQPCSDEELLDRLDDI